MKSYQEIQEAIAKAQPDRSVYELIVRVQDIYEIAADEYDDQDAALAYAIATASDEYTAWIANLV